MQAHAVTCCMPRALCPVHATYPTQVFPPAASQIDVFEGSGVRGLIDKALQGYSATVFGMSYALRRMCGMMLVRVPVAISLSVRFCVCAGVNACAGVSVSTVAWRVCTPAMRASCLSCSMRVHAATIEELKCASVEV